MNRCFTIREFCEAHRISRALFYKLAGENRAPKSFHVGHRRLISEESASEWRTFMLAKFPAEGSIKIHQEAGV